jgi:hypothetical protein
LENAGVEVPVEAVTTSPGGVDRPLNGVLAAPRTQELGIPALRDWREALDDYMARAELGAAA